MRKNAYSPILNLETLVSFLLLCDYYRYLMINKNNNDDVVWPQHQGSQSSSLPPPHRSSAKERTSQRSQWQTWIMDYLTGKPQYVRVNGCASEVVISNTDAGTVLAPFLFTLYTTDFGSCPLQKLSNNSSNVGCISNDNEEEYRWLIESFVTWYHNSHLKLNISKPKSWWWTTRRTGGPLSLLSFGERKWRRWIHTSTLGSKSIKTVLVSQHRRPLQKGTKHIVLHFTWNNNQSTLHQYITAQRCITVHYMCTEVTETTDIYHEGMKLENKIKSATVRNEEDGYIL